jgi:hypothetical protein
MNSNILQKPSSSISTGNPYYVKKLQGELRMQNIRIGQKNYSVVTEWISEACQIQTHLPIQWGRSTLSDFDILELYAGKSLKLGIREDDKTSGYFITSASYDVDMVRVGEFFLGTYFVNITNIFPCYCKNKETIDGYICQNIYIPKNIQTSCTQWTIGELEAAALAHHGKTVDLKTNQILMIPQFNNVKEKAAISEKAVLAEFHTMPYDETLDLKDTQKIKP